MIRIRIEGIRVLRRPRRCAIRSLAVYAVGEGWTGALGMGLDQVIPGHFDEEDEHDAVLPPMYVGPIESAAVGWGHTAVLTKQHELLLAGRPHDFSSLLRLKRLPKWIRDYSVRQTLATTVNDAGPNNDEQTRTNERVYNIFNPTELVAGFVTALADAFSPDSKDWETARQQSILPKLTAVSAGNLESGDYPVQVACSAGFSALLTKKGYLYAFGLNGYGQCGIGVTNNNVWQPTRVTGLSSEFAQVPRAEMEQSFPIIQAALGLQHGVCLNSHGEVFCWGKGERGQLGQETTMMESHTALPVKRAFSLGIHENTSADSSNPKPSYHPIGKVCQIAAGMIHSAALCEDGRVLIWGKHLLPPIGNDVGKKPASDAILPFVLAGLPLESTVEQIACGSHHTAVLLEDGSVWAVGISSDTKEPMHQPTCLIPAGIVEMPVLQFAAHMDRTTIVGKSGRQVLQVNLWKDPALQEYAVFTPIWLDRLLKIDEKSRIREVHRGWVHSVAVIEP